MFRDSDFRRRASALIPGGAHTYSKGDDQLPANAPAAFISGKGGHAKDLDGRDWIDWGMGIHNVLIGHAEPAIDDAAIAALRLGQNLSRPTPLEVEAAETVLALFEGLDMIKFAKDGSDVNSAAIRLARAITGRSLVAFDSTAPFHAIDDWFIGNTPVSAGVAEPTVRLTVPFAYNDLDSLERMFATHGSELAALILEPCRFEMPLPAFLPRVRQLCDSYGTLLIFDEIITGFRFDLGGGHRMFGIRPDLMAIGKAMGNGYAISALVGKREHMERGGLEHTFDRCFLLSTTNGAERSALAAAIAVVRFYQANPVIERIAAIGRQLMDGLRQAAVRHGVAPFVHPASDFDARPAWHCRDASGAISLPFRTLFLQELLRAGIFMPWVAVCFRHDEEDVCRTLDGFDKACRVYAEALDAGTVAHHLEGPPVRPVMRRLNR